MKRIVALLLVIILLVSLCSCGNSQKEDVIPDPVDQENSEVQEKTDELEKTSDNTDPVDQEKPEVQEKADKLEKTPDNTDSEPEPLPAQENNAASPQPKKHTHSYSKASEDKATCEHPGQITYACACGDSYVEYTDALGHSFNSGVCSRCGVNIVSLCSVSSVTCPDQLTYHYVNPSGIEIKTHPIRSLSVSDVYFESRGDDVVLHLAITGTVSSNVADGDGFGYVVLGGDGSGRIEMPAEESKNYYQEFEFTDITPGSYTISLEDFYHNS